MTSDLYHISAEVTATLKQRVASQKYKDDPALWAREYLGIELWSKQIEIIESIRDNRNTAVAAGHGVGKTFCAGIAVAWWVDTHPPDKTFIASTAPSVDQVALLWDNLRRVHGIAKKRYDDGLVDHALPGYITGDNKWKLDDGSLLGQGRKPPDNLSDVAFQGRHADYLFAIGDEAVGLAAGFLEALGNIATAATNRQLLLANPTDPNSAMAKLWAPQIKSWNRMHISVFDSPAVTEDPGFDITKAPALSGWEYINDKRDEWGEDDPRYIARVLGQWAFDAGNTVFTAEEIANCKNTYVLPDPDCTPEPGWDIARFGSDSTVGYVAVRGEVWLTDPETGAPTVATGHEGVRIRQLDKWSKVPLIALPENDSTARRIHEHALALGAEVVKVDAAGIGGGVIDGLDVFNKGEYAVIELMGSAPARDKRQYVNFRADQIFEMKKWAAKGYLDLDPADEKLFEEMQGIQYELTDGSIIKIESKETIRKQGRKSPDHFDACWYAFVDVADLIDPDRPKRGDKVVLDPANLEDSWDWSFLEEWGDAF